MNDSAVNSNSTGDENPEATLMMSKLVEQAAAAFDDIRRYLIVGEASAIQDTIELARRARRDLLKQFDLWALDQPATAVLTSPENQGDDID